MLVLNLTSHAAEHTMSQTANRCMLYTSLQGQKMYGNRWTLIASLLPGRCNNDIKNYYNLYLKQQVPGGRVANRYSVLINAWLDLLLCSHASARCNNGCQFCNRGNQLTDCGDQGNDR